MRVINMTETKNPMRVVIMLILDVLEVSKWARCGMNFKVKGLMGTEGCQIGETFSKNG